jgi:hypothetical protein
LANDLAEKMNVQDWKLNPNYNTFVRNISKSGPARHNNTPIDWKASKVKAVTID